MTAPREPPFRKGDPIPGTPYVFNEILGRGGHGIVVRATHTFLDKPVVIKLLHAELGTDEDLVRRSLQEAKILAKMEHPNIVGVTDGGMTGEHPPRPFFVMDALQGLVLYHALKAAPKGLGFATSVKHRPRRPRWTRLRPHATQGRSSGRQAVQYLHPPNAKRHDRSEASRLRYRVRQAGRSTHRTRLHRDAEVLRAGADPRRDPDGAD